MLIRRLIKNLRDGFFIGLISLVLLEFAYRFYIVDFYYKELIELNTTDYSKYTNIDLLVFGDSFSANPTGYVDFLRQLFPEKKIINSSIQGTGIFQTNIIAKKRINQFKPKAVLYQTYEGNDLIDLKYPVDWKKYSIGRNLYWSASHYFRVFPFINYKLKIFRAKNSNLKTASNLIKSNKPYTDRTKMFLNGNPNYLQQINELNGEYKNIFSNWENHWIKLNKNLDVVGQKYLLHIPHCVQINKKYAQIYHKLAPDFKDVKLACPSEFENRISQVAGKNYHTIDVCNEFRMLDQIKPLYFDFDPHLNLVGQEELAKIVARHLNW